MYRCGEPTAVTSHFTSDKFLKIGHGRRLWLLSHYLKTQSGVLKARNGGDRSSILGWRMGIRSGVLAVHGGSKCGKRGLLFHLGDSSQNRSFVES